MATANDNSGADIHWDTYAERVLRNEGRLSALEQLVRETREADRRLIEQRSDSLAGEAERARNALQDLTQEQREADNREHRDSVSEQNRHMAAMTAIGEEKHLALNQRVDACNDQQEQRWAADDARWAQAARLYEARVESMEQRRAAGLDALDQRVRQWRESDTEARVLQADEYARRLDVLNHAHEKQVEFQANSVSRELFGAEQKAQVEREAALRDQIIALEKSLIARAESALDNTALTLDTKIEVVKDAMGDLRRGADITSGKSIGKSTLAAYAFGIVGSLGSLILIANILTSKAV